MKRVVKAVLIGSLLAAGMISLVRLNTSTIRDCWGHRWRSWIHCEPTQIYDWKDSQEKMFWKITNNTNMRLTAESDSHAVKLKPGRSANLRRAESFEIKVTDGKMKTRIETDNHYVELYMSRGRIRVRSFTEWPGRP